MENIGERICKLRNEKGVSQEKLSFELGVSRQTISRWERSEVSPTVENLESLSKFFGVNSDYFLSGEEVQTEIKEQLAVAEEVKPQPKFKSLKILVAVIASAVLVLFAIACGIVAYVAAVPVQGQDVATANRFNSTGIVFFVLGILATVTAVTLAVLFIKKGKKN